MSTLSERSCELLLGVLIIPLIMCFIFWLAVKWSGTWMLWPLKVPSFSLLSLFLPSFSNFSAAVTSPTTRCLHCTENKDAMRKAAGKMKGQPRRRGNAKRPARAHRQSQPPFRQGWYSDFSCRALISMPRAMFPPPLMQNWWFYFLWRVGGEKEHISSSSLVLGCGSGMFSIHLRSDLTW